MKWHGRTHASIVVEIYGACTYCARVALLGNGLCVKCWDWYCGEDQTANNKPRARSGTMRTKLLEQAVGTVVQVSHTCGANCQVKWVVRRLNKLVGKWTYYHLSKGLAVVERSA